MAQPSLMDPTVMNPAAVNPQGANPQGMIQSAQASPPDVTADGSKTSPGLLSDWYSSYMSKNPAASAAVTTPTKWGMTPDQTVQGQVGKVIDAGGPLMERAATRASTASAGRGLLNSTMGVQAGQAALYDVALPIATADANINAQAGQFNANAANSAGQFNANAANTATAAQSLAGVSGAQQEAGLRQQTMLQSTDLANQRGMQDRSLSSQASLQQVDIANQTALQKANATLQTGLQATDLGVRQSMQNYQLAVQQAMNGKDNDTRMKVATLDASTQTSLAELNNKYRVQLQTSSAMAATYQNLVDGITRVMINPDATADTKIKQVDDLRGLYNGALDLQSKLTGLDLGHLLGGGATASTPTPTDSTVEPLPTPSNKPLPRAKVSPELTESGG